MGHRTTVAHGCHVTAKPLTNLVPRVLSLPPARYLILPWNFCFCREVFGFAVWFSVLSWRIWFCREVLGSAVTPMGHRTGTLGREKILRQLITDRWRRFAKFSAVNLVPRVLSLLLSRDRKREDPGNEVVPLFYGNFSIMTQAPLPLHPDWNIGIYTL